MVDERKTVRLSSSLQVIQNDVCGFVNKEVNEDLNVNFPKLFVLSHIIASLSQIFISY